MTDTPERIWLGHPPTDKNYGFAYVSEMDFPTTEYVRADLSPAAVTVKRDARCIIAFADDSVPDAHIDNVEDAKRTLEKMRDNWTCRMFVDFEALAPAAVTVKPLEWEDDEVGTLTAKDFKIYRLDHPRREIWRLVQADFGTTYRGDFGGNDGKERAMEVAATIEARRVIASINVAPAPVADVTCPACNATIIPPAPDAQPEPDVQGDG